MFSALAPIFDYLNGLPDSTKRALRTVYAVVVAFVTYAPMMWAVVVKANDDAQLANPGTLVLVGTTLATWCGVVNRVINKLEDSGKLPAFLRKPEVDKAVEATDPPLTDTEQVEALQDAADEKGADEQEAEEELIDPEPAPVKKTAAKKATKKTTKKKG